MIRTVILGILLSVTTLFGQWRIGYYSPNSYDGGLPVSGIYYAPYTHLIHYNSYPEVSGTTVTLNTTYYGVSTQSDSLVWNAHLAGVKVLLCVGIGGADSAMSLATDATHLSAFVDAIMSYVSAHNYDGVDIDWEGSTYGPANYAGQYVNLVAALRTRLDAYNSALGGKGVLTAYFGPETVAAQVAPKLDLLTVNCYDDFRWDFKLVWFNAALYDPLIQGQNRTCQNVVNVFRSAGVPVASMSAGIPFYGYKWTGGLDASGQGALRPGQTLLTAAGYQGVTYSRLIADATLWQDQYKHWDSNSQVPYLSIDNPGSANDSFVTYENESSVTAKWNFVKSNQLGGITVYPIGADWISTGATQAAQHPLAEALRVAATAVSATAPSITSSSPLPSGLVGTAFTFTLAATGTTPISWSITSGALPAGLSLDTTAGVIAGTPTAAGTATFTVTASNSAGTSQKPLSMTVTAPQTTFRISGRITTLYGGLAGVTIMAGNSPATTTDSTGNYSLSVKSGTTVTIQPVKYRYAFTPASFTAVSISADTTANFSAKRIR